MANAGSDRPEKQRFNEKVISLIHRWSGRVFLLIYLALAAVMILRFARSNAPLDTRTIIHATLAFSIAPILVVKIFPDSRR